MRCIVSHLGVRKRVKWSNDLLLSCVFGVADPKGSASLFTSCLALCGHVIIFIQNTNIMIKRENFPIFRIEEIFHAAQVCKNECEYGIKEGEKILQELEKRSQSSVFNTDEDEDFEFQIITHMMFCRISLIGANNTLNMLIPHFN